MYLIEEFINLDHEEETKGLQVNLYKVIFVI